MWQLHYISKAAELAALSAPLGLNRSSAPLQTGCASPRATKSAFFCDYVQHVLEINYKPIWQEINTTGGLAIYTTPEHAGPARGRPRRQLRSAAEATAVLNPGHNADTEVLIQPGTGYVRAIAVNRKFGQGPGEDAHRLRGQHAVRRRRWRADRLVIEDVHADHRPEAGLAFWPHHQGQGPGNGRPVPQLQRPDCVNAAPLQQRGGSKQGHRGLADEPGHGRLDQPLLRQPGAAGRPLQCGQDCGRHGHDPGRRHVADEVRQDARTQQWPAGCTTTPASRLARCTCRR